MIKRIFASAYAVLVVLMATIVIALSLSPAFNVLYSFNSLTTIDEVEYSVNGMPQGSVQLPKTITGLEPGDKVRVVLESSGKSQDNLLVRVDNAECVLAIDGETYFTTGSRDTYPSYQREPPRTIDILALPNLDAGVELSLTYTISSIGNSLELQPLHSGDQNLIIKRVALENYLPLILSVLMLVLGVALAISGRAFVSRAEFAIVLFWLGLACFASGCWVLCSNDTILLFFGQFSVLYTLSYLGLFILPVPLGRFCINFLKPYRSLVLEGIFIAYCVLFLALIALHVGGYVSFGQVGLYFRIVGSLFLLVFVIMASRVRHSHDTLISALFLFGFALFAGLAVFDALSGYLGLERSAGSFFAIGLFFATIVIALLVWEYVSDAFDALEKNVRLEADISNINRSLELQRKHFQDFAQSAEDTRRMRHDLRHQLVAIQGLISESKKKDALEYIDNLSQSIPSISEMLICDNVAVNSLAVHYMAQAEEKSILCDVNIVVPAVAGRIPDSDLSIIVGNLFENAIEACMHVEPEKRFIKVRSNINSNRLTLIIDNSFDGELNLNGTDFYSRKRKGFGVGIASVRSVIKKYDGSMKHETESGVFKTSLYVKM